MKTSPALRRALSAAIGLVMSSPVAALACPQCAGRADGGVAKAVLLGSFILLPFAIVGTVWRIIRAEALRTSSHPESGS